MIPTNTNGKNFTWAPSSIKDYITCPRQYGEKRFYESLPFVETEAARNGNIEHKALERRIKSRTPLPEGYTRGEVYCYQIEKIFAGETILAEVEMATDRDMKFVSWFDKTAYGRCKIDLLAIKRDTAVIWDWKTGNISDDKLQLKINACFVAEKYPYINNFNTRYIWLKPGITTGEVYTRDQIPEMWREIMGWVKRMEGAWINQTFDTKPSGLCRNYCQVTKCLHCGKGRR